MNRMAFDLAVLIAAPHAGDTSMHNDLVAMYEALRRLGVLPESILSIEGELTRRLLLDFLRSVQERVANWQEKRLFLYVGGHGFFVGDDAQSAKVGIELVSSQTLSDTHHIFWQEIFETLALPATVSLLLLPDH